MIGESLEEFIIDNKKTRREKALYCLDFLRSLTDEDIKRNSSDYLDTLSLLLELINDKDPYDQISLEDIDTNEKEIKSFEEKSVLIEDEDNSVGKNDTTSTK